MNILKKATTRAMTVLLAFAAVFSALTLLSPGMRAEAAGTPSAQIVSWATKDQSHQLRSSELLYLDIKGFDTVTEIEWNNNFPKPWLPLPFTDICGDFNSRNNTMYMGLAWMVDSTTQKLGPTYRWFSLMDNGPHKYRVSAKVTGTANGQTVTASTSYSNFASANLQKDLAAGAYSLWVNEPTLAKYLLADAGMLHVICEYVTITQASPADTAVVKSEVVTTASTPDFTLTGLKPGITTITLGVSKTKNCSYHPGQSANSTVAIGVFKKPVISSTPMSITLTNTDAGCTYTINGESKTCKTDNESLVFEDLQPDTQYNLELSRQSQQGKTSKTTTVNTAKAYQLRYTANGGMEDPENQLPGATSIEADLAITNIIPTRDGYVFTGWSRYANGYVEHQALSDEEAKTNGYYASVASAKGTDDATAVPYRTSIEKLFGLKIELSDHNDPTPTKTTYMGNTVLFAQWQPMVAEVAIQLQKDDKPLTKALTDKHTVDLYRAGALAYRLEAATETGKYSNKTVQNGTYSIYVDEQDTGKTVTVASVATGLRAYTKGNTSMTLNYYDVKLSVTLDEAAWADKSVALYRPYDSKDANGNPITAYAKKYDLTKDAVTPGLYHFEDLELGAVSNDYDIFVDGEGTALTDTTENIVVDKLGAKNTNARDVRYFNAQIPVTLDDADWTAPTITLTRTAKNVDEGATADSVDKTYTLAYDPALQYYTGIVQEGKYELYAGYAYYFNGDKSLGSTFVTLSGSKTGSAERMSTQLFYYAARPDAPFVTTEERQKVEALGQPMVDKNNNPVMEQVKVEHVYTEQTPLEVFTLSFYDSSDPATAVRYELAAYNAFLPHLVQKGTQVYSPGNPTKRNSKFQQWVDGNTPGSTVFAKSDTTTLLLIDKATNVYSEWNSPLVTLHAYVKGGEQGKYAFPNLTLTQFDSIRVTNATVRFYRGTVQSDGSLLYDEDPIIDEKWAYTSLAKGLTIGTDYLVFTEKADGGVQMNIDFPNMAIPAQAQELLKQIQYTVKLPAGETNTYYRVELKVYGDAGTNVNFNLNDGDLLPTDELAARWKINNKDTFTYTQKVNTKDESGEGTVTQPGDPQRKNYVFVGWYKDAAGTQVFNFETDKIPDNVETTLYATWKIDSNNELTFDINGGTLVKNGGDWKDSGSVIQRVYLSNPYAVEPGATRTGYLFDGWYTELTGGTKFNFVTNTVKAPQTLYAHWTARTYEVRMELTDGSFTNADQQLTLTHTYDAPTDLPGVERRGYDFKGWTYPVYTKDDSVSDWGATANSTYYVYDDPTSSYVLAVTFDDDATYYTAATQNIDLTPDPGGDASKDKYILPGDAIVSNNALTAKWEAQKYAITYDKMESLDTTGYPTVHTFGTNTTLPAAPTKAGYVFEGWYVPVVADEDTFTSYYVCDASGVFNTATGAFDGATTYYQPLTVLDGSVYLEGITVTAGWNVAHTVTFELTGGAWATADTASTATVGNGRFVTKPDGGKDPTQSGYLFNGWKNSGTDFDFDTMPITSSITLTAQWAAATPVKLDANLDGVPGVTDGFEIQLTPGNPDAIPPVPPTFEYKLTLTVDAPIGGLMPSITAPRREGYTFEGWFWYQPVTVEPSNWATKFADYYISDGADGYKHPELTYVAPNFAAGKYFVIRAVSTPAVTATQYADTTNQPSDWGATTYYTLNGTVYTAVASGTAYESTTTYHTLTNWGADMSGYQVKNVDGTYTPVAPGEAYDSAKNYVTLAYDMLVADPDTLKTEPVPAIPFAPEYTEYIGDGTGWDPAATQYFTKDADGKYTAVPTDALYGTSTTYYTLTNWNSTTTYYTMNASFVLTAATAFDPDQTYYTIGAALTWANDWVKSLEKVSPDGGYKPTEGKPVTPIFVSGSVYAYVKWTLTDEKNESGTVTTSADTVDTGKPGTLYAEWTLTPPTP